MVTHRSNIVLIGMPGVGKSTVGVLLAKRLGLGFIDTDILIQQQEGASLQALIASRGAEAFCRIEECHILSLVLNGHVIAPGGSVVYSQPAMAHLKTGGIAVHLDIAVARLPGSLSPPGRPLQASTPSAGRSTSLTPTPPWRPTG